MCISRHGALVSFAYLLRFFQFPSDMHVSNPRQILWTVCVENVKPLSYLASSFGHNFWKYTANQLYVSLLGPYEWQQPLGIVFLVCITRENLRVRLSIGRREAGVFKNFPLWREKMCFWWQFSSGTCRPNRRKNVRLSIKTDMPGAREDGPQFLLRKKECWLHQCPAGHWLISSWEN